MRQPEVRGGFFAGHYATGPPRATSRRMSHFDRAETTPGMPARHRALRQLELLVREARRLRRLDDDEAVVQRRMAGVASVGQRVVGLGELLGVAGAHRLVE